MKDGQRYTLLPFKNPLSLSARIGSGTLYTETWVPCRPRYLFLDPTDGLLVESLMIGDRTCHAGIGEGMPARIFELRELLNLSDLHTLVLAAGGPIKVSIEQTATWPLPLALPELLPGLSVSLVLRSALDSTRVIRGAFAVVERP